MHVKIYLSFDDDDKSGDGDYNDKTIALLAEVTILAISERCKSDACESQMSIALDRQHPYMDDDKAAVFNCFHFYNFCPKPPNFSPPWILAASLV